MSTLSKLLARVQETVYTAMFSKKTSVRCDPPLVSFTFDDVPVSAIDNGLPALDRHGFKATFYVANGIAKSSEEKEFFLSEQHLVKLAREGHEIGCHTFSHRRLNFASTSEATSEFEENQESIVSVLPGIRLENFSYPYGEIGLFAKKAVKGRFNSARTSKVGLNYGTVDLTYLKAINLYSDSISRAEITSILDKARLEKAWVIFYTHDINSKHTPWGTTQEDFEWVVQYCRDKGFDVQPVYKALQRLHEIS